MIADSKKQMKADYSKDELFAEAEAQGLNPRKNMNVDSLIALVFKEIRKTPEVKPLDNQTEPEVKPTEPEVKPEVEPTEPEVKPEVEPTEPTEPEVTPDTSDVKELPPIAVGDTVEVYLPGTLGPTRLTKDSEFYFVTDKGVWYRAGTLADYLIHNRVS